ncbi:hypothetical protein C8R42DRAFT_291482 [Lentinula raphanica]|nr:hypothetical protein C8R42DRAFT_291482 [Lentinula raphanica]
MRITTGHILLCLIAITQTEVGAQKAGKVKNIPPTTPRYRGKLKSGVTKSPGPSINSHHEPEVVPPSSEQRSSSTTQKNPNKDVINLRFREGTIVTSTDSDHPELAQSPNHETPLPNSDSVPIPIHSFSAPSPEIHSELTTIFEKFREELGMDPTERPFRLTYRNQLLLDDGRGSVYTPGLEENDHHVYFWGARMTKHCTKDDGRCLLYFHRSLPPEHRAEGDSLASVIIGPERDPEGGTNVCDWPVPFSVREEVVQRLPGGGVGHNQLG